MRLVWNISNVWNVIIILKCITCMEKWKQGIMLFWALSTYLLAWQQHGLSLILDNSNNLWTEKSWSAYCPWQSGLHSLQAMQNLFWAPILKTKLKLGTFQKGLQQNLIFSVKIFRGLNYGNFWSIINLHCLRLKSRCLDLSRDFAFIFSCSIFFYERESF